MSHAVPQIMSCPCVTADVPHLVILWQAAHCQCGRYLALHAACSVAITSTFMQLMLWPSSRLSCCLRCRHRLALHAACAVAIALPFMQLALSPSPRLSCCLRCGYRLAFHAACAVTIASPFILHRRRKACAHCAGGQFLPVPLPKKRRRPHASGAAFCHTVRAACAIASRIICAFSPR